MNDLITIENLQKRYGDFSLNIPFMNVPAGSIVGFVGENGAGKTTTIKALLGAIHPDSGRITLLGNKTGGADNAVKEQLGVVLDGSNFPESLCPHQISLCMAGIYRGWDSDYYKRLCGNFELPLKKPLKEFSRGMKMKLSIAVALAHHPRLLLLDEATGGLDPIARDELLDLLLEFIQSEERGVLFSSHITTDIEKVADYVVFLHRGAIVFEENKDVLLQEYGILKCSPQQEAGIDRNDVIKERKTSFGYEFLVKEKDALSAKYPDCVMDRTTIEAIMLFYAERRSML